MFPFCRLLSYVFVLFSCAVSVIGLKALVSEHPTTKKLIIITTIIYFVCCAVSVIGHVAFGSARK